jgi:hypothetical protein
MLASAVSACLETILSRRVAKLSRLSFGRLSPDEAQKMWEPVVLVCASFCPQLQDAFADGLKNKERIRKTLGIVQSLVQSTAQPKAATFKAFADKVK